MNTEFVSVIEKLHFASMFWLLILPTSMMGIDVLTGLLGAWVRKDFQSAKMRAGLAKKCGELLIILIGILFTYGMELPDLIITCISLYIILMELMSVVENLDKLGAPLPKVIKDVINNVGHSIQEDDYAKLMKKMKAVDKMIEENKALLTAIEVERDSRISKGGE